MTYLKRERAKHFICHITCLLLLSLLGILEPYRWTVSHNNLLDRRHESQYLVFITEGGKFGIFDVVIFVSHI